MLNHSTAAARANRVYLRAEDCRVEDLAAICEATVDLADYPFAADVQKNVLIYDCPSLLPALGDPADRRALMAEWAEAMLTGPQNMPVFNDLNLTPEEKKDIISYLTYIQENPSAGGLELGSLGPVSEGLFLWVFGLGAIVALTVWVTAKSN